MRVRVWVRVWARVGEVWARVGEVWMGAGEGEGEVWGEREDGCG